MGKGALRLPVRLERLFSSCFLPCKGVQEIGSPPSYQCYVADQVCCALHLSIFALFNTMSVKQRRTLTFAANKDIIRHIENGEKWSTVANEKIPQSALSTLLWNTSDIKKKTA